MPAGKLPLLLLLCAFVHAAYLLFPCSVLHCKGVAVPPLRDPFAIYKAYCYGNCV